MAKPDKPDKRHEIMCAALDLFADRVSTGPPWP